MNGFGSRRSPGNTAHSRPNAKAAALAVTGIIAAHWDRRIACSVEGIENLVKVTATRTLGSNTLRDGIWPDASPLSTCDPTMTNSAILTVPRVNLLCSAGELSGVR